MGVLRPKTRMVSFRLTENEYNVLLSTCVANGARSVSDFTRARMSEILAHNGGPNGTPVEARVEELRCWIQQLDKKVQRLTRATARADPE